MDFQLFHTGKFDIDAATKVSVVDVDAEHCLEHFRELALCRGDIAVTTFLYRGGRKTAKLLAEHECVNWDRLQDWVSLRAIDLSTPDITLPVEQSEQFEHPESS